MLQHVKVRILFSEVLAYLVLKIVLAQISGFSGSSVSMG